MNNYLNLSNLMLIILEESYVDMDVTCAMNILVFSNTFYLEQKEPVGQKAAQKNYLQNGIAQHKIWADFKFWERAIYECISQELQ